MYDTVLMLSVRTSMHAVNFKTQLHCLLWFVVLLCRLFLCYRAAGAESFVSGDGSGSNSANDSFNMMKTIVIAVCSAVAYLAIVVGLTVYCSIRLMRAKNQRKQRQPNDVTTNGIGAYRLNICIESGARHSHQSRLCMYEIIFTTLFRRR
jgi:hypothetical protein